MPGLDKKRGIEGQQILKAGTILFDGSGIVCLVRTRGRKPNRHSELIRLGYRHRAQQSPLSRCLAKGAADRYRVRLRTENPAASTTASACRQIGGPSARLSVASNARRAPILSDRGLQQRASKPHRTRSYPRKQTSIPKESVDHEPLLGSSGWVSLREKYSRQKS
jgi:hypothetical protein